MPSIVTWPPVSFFMVLHLSKHGDTEPEKVLESKIPTADENRRVIKCQLTV